MREPSASTDSRAVLPALERVTAALAHHEHRPAQQRMAAAVADAIARRHHLIVAAGTGTGKSLAYLVPALAAGTRCVVATATKALQDQLAQHDLPVVAAALGDPVNFAVLKGRSNYICRQRVAEIGGGGDQLTLDDQLTRTDQSDDDQLTGGDRKMAFGPFAREVQRLAAWSTTAQTGDRADLPFEPSFDAWAQVSVGPRDCPGAARCPAGDECFAEAARKRAGEADVVVVNTHLYAAHLASGGEVLPPTTWSSSTRPTNWRTSPRPASASTWPGAGSMPWPGPPGPYSTTPPRWRPPAKRRRCWSRRSPRCGAADWPAPSTTPSTTV